MNIEYDVAVDFEKIFERNRAWTTSPQVKPHCVCHVQAFDVYRYCVLFVHVNLTGLLVRCDNEKKVNANANAWTRRIIIRTQSKLKE